jgi:hypothetical protein
MWRTIAAVIALSILVPLSARPAAAATTKATVSYVIPQGADPHLITFGAVNSTLFVDPADLACGDGTQLHARILGSTPGTLADVVQVRMTFEFDGDVDVNSIAGALHFSPWTADISHVGNMWTIVFTQGPPSAALQQTTSSISDAAGFAYVDICIPGDPTNSAISNVTFTATKLGKDRVPPPFPLVGIATYPPLLSGCNSRSAVLVFGKVYPNGAAIAPGTATYSLTDEYGTFTSSGAVTLTPTATPGVYSFSFIVPLDPTVNPGDPDGRHYNVMFCVSDTAARQTCVSVGATISPCPVVGN